MNVYEKGGSYEDKVLIIVPYNVKYITWVIVKTLFGFMYNINPNTKELQEWGLKISGAEYFVMTSMLTWHMGSRWYTSDLHAFAIDL
jgi:hypothetical protein